MTVPNRCEIRPGLPPARKAMSVPPREGRAPDKPGGLPRSRWRSRHRRCAGLNRRCWRVARGRPVGADTLRSSRAGRWRTPHGSADGFASDRIRRVGSLGWTGGGGTGGAALAWGAALRAGRGVRTGIRPAGRRSGRRLGWPIPDTRARSAVRPQHVKPCDEQQRQHGRADEEIHESAVLAAARGPGHGALRGAGRRRGRRVAGNRVHERPRPELWNDHRP